MNDADVMLTGFPEAGLDLKQATGICRDDHLRPRLNYVLYFAFLQLTSHFRFGQVVASRATAAEIRLSKLNEFAPRLGFHQLAWLCCYSLRVSQVVGLVIS